jgi:predicted TIM-barrel fold metal-dependent hydrolase
MKPLNYTPFIVLGLIMSLLTAPVFAQSSRPATSAPSQNDGAELLVKDFKPRPMLHAREHEIVRARFPVIDIHSHLNDAGMITRAHMPAEKVVQWMDRHNVQTVVILSGASGERLQRVIDKMVKPFPDRFVVFTQPDWSRINEPDFGAQMAALIHDSVSRGARGLKITKELGLVVRDSTGKLLTVDDRRLDPMWEQCGKLGIPVAIHSGDPEAFFLPIDPANERYEQLRARPEYRFYGKDYPTHQAVLDALERVFARHPRTTFVSLHFGNWSENLDYVEGILEKYPNVYVEFGARQGELGRQPNRTRKFFLRHPDRILFGTDGNSEVGYTNLFRWLETDDDNFEFFGYPYQGRWRISGLYLPDEVLEKIYNQNARQIFSQFQKTQ